MSDQRTERRPARRGLVGRVLGGRYRVDRVVSAGASTLIVDAQDTELHRLVTLKLVRPEWAEDPEFRRRFRGTMRAMAGLSHPNLAAVYDWGEETVGQRTTVYAVTEYLDGGSLRDLFDRGRYLDPSQALLVGLEACRGLDFAHRKGLVHGELTPSKLVFGDDRRLRIVDFGLARLLGARDWQEPATLATHVARYASPEQATGAPLDGRSDVYSLTLILVEAVGRSVPFDAGSTVATLAARIGRLMPVSADLGPLAAILERAGRPVAADRSSAAELGRALVRAAEKLPRPAPIPILATNRFEDMELRRPNDPTGGLARPEPEPGVALVPPPDAVETVDDAEESAAETVAEAAAAASAAAVVADAPEPLGGPSAAGTGAEVAASGEPTDPPPAPPAAASPEVATADDAEETAVDTVAEVAAASPAALAAAEPLELATPPSAAAPIEVAPPTDLVPIEMAPAAARSSAVAPADDAVVADDTSEPAVPPAEGDAAAPAVAPDRATAVEARVEPPPTADPPPPGSVAAAPAAAPPADRDPVAPAPPGAPHPSATGDARTVGGDVGTDAPGDERHRPDTPEEAAAEAQSGVAPAPPIPEPGGERAGRELDADPGRDAPDAHARAATSGPPAVYDGDTDATKDELAELARARDEPPALDTAIAAPRATTAADRAAPTSRRRRGLTALVAFAILAALAVLGLLAYVMFRVPTHPVPDLAGMTLEDAQDAVAEFDWKVDVRRERSDDEPDEGDVIRTAPTSGSDLAEGEPLLLVVSDGPKLRVLPELTGLTSAAAETALAELQLTAVAAGEDYDEDTPAGDVLSWRVADDPSLVAGGEVLPGTEISYVVSKGPEPRILPDLRNLTIESARAELDRRRLQLVVGDAVFDADIVAGAVVAMDPPAGTSVERGSTVTVTPSKGPDLVTVPQIGDLTLAEARVALAAAGLQVGNLLGNTQGHVVQVSHLGRVVVPGDQFLRHTALDLALF